jgi:hypothetical protein
MNNTIIYLIGLPGVGKFTIGKEINKRTGARLIDNQLINNPIFSLIAADGFSPLPEIIWDRIGAIRRIIWDGFTADCWQPVLKRGCILTVASASRWPLSAEAGAAKQRAVLVRCASPTV